MSVQNTFKNTINDFGSKIRDGSHVKDVVTKMIASINQSNIVTPNVKKAINQHFGINPGTRMMTGGHGDAYKAKNVSSHDLLVATTLYYLSDLNRYDFNLINYAYNYNLGVGDIITLLLLNNIHDINAFCKKYSLMGDQYHSIATLKKLSALHKIQFNF